MPEIDDVDDDCDETDDLREFAGDGIGDPSLSDMLGIQIQGN